MWVDISMDIVLELPKLGNTSVIMVVFSHLSKNDHLCALEHTFKASIVAQIFMDNIFQLHGIPKSIVTNIDPTFTNNF
jgi:hypothetical protein